MFQREGVFQLQYLQHHLIFRSSEQEFYLIQAKKNQIIRDLTLERGGRVQTYQLKYVIGRQRRNLN